MKPALGLGLLGLLGCAPLAVPGELVSACQFYVTVAAITAGIPAAADITRVVDPVCKLVLAGQPAPAGTTAADIRTRTTALEELAVAHGAASQRLAR